MNKILTWRERCEIHPDHQSGMITSAMIDARMKEEIAELRAALEWKIPNNPPKEDGIYLAVVHYVSTVTVKTKSGEKTVTSERDVVELKFYNARCDDWYPYPGSTIKRWTEIPYLEPPPPPSKEETPIEATVRIAIEHRSRVEEALKKMEKEKRELREAYVLHVIKHRYWLADDYRRLQFYWIVPPGEFNHYPAEKVEESDQPIHEWMKKVDDPFHPEPWNWFRQG